MGWLAHPGRRHQQSGVRLLESDYSGEYVKPLSEWHSVNSSLGKLQGVRA